MNILHRIALLFDKKAMAEAYANRYARTKFVLNDKAIEHAFTATNKTTKEVKSFYRFKDIMDMPPRRYSNWSARMNELSMGVNREYLMNLRELLTKTLSGGKGQIDLAEAGRYINDLYARLLLAPGEDEIYYAASIEYFTLDEDLTDYNFQLNDEKIQFWKDSFEGYGFFLQKPVRELLGWERISKRDLENHLTKARLNIQSSRRLLPLLNKGGKPSKTTSDTTKN